jgi:hypothetical protein
MFTLVNVKQENSNTIRTNNVASLNSLNLNKIKPIQCNSINTAFLKFMHKILVNSKNQLMTLRLTIMDSNKKLHTKTVVRKKLNNRLNEYEYIHFIKK